MKHTDPVIINQLPESPAMKSRVASEPVADAAPHYVGNEAELAASPAVMVKEACEVRRDDRQRTTTAQQLHTRSRLPRIPRCL
jgi:hypothetical protein